MSDEAPPTGQRTPARRPWQPLVRVVAFVVLAAILAWAASHLDWRLLGHSIRSCDRRLVLAAAVMNCLVMALQGWRWFSVLRVIGPVSYFTAYGALIVSFALSSVLPARAGELLRISYMAKRMGTSGVAVAGTAVLDHVVNGLAFIPFLLLLPFVGGYPPWLRRGLTIAIVVIVMAALALWSAAKPGAPSEKPSRWRLWIEQIRHGFGAARSPRDAATAFIAAFLGWAAEVVVTWFTLRAFVPHESVAAAILVLAGVNLALAIPSPPANLGTLEMGAVVALTAIGWAQEKAVAFALVYHVLQLVTVWLLGVPAGFYLRGYGLKRSGSPSSP